MKRRIFLFADEAGCFNFSRKQNVSRHFVVCTIALETCDAAARLLDLRRQLAWNNIAMGPYFHASTDRQEIRNYVFELLDEEKFKIQATILEKTKAHPHLRLSEEAFYRLAWHYHFQSITDGYCTAFDEIHLTIASIGTKRKKTAFEDAVRQVAATTTTTKTIQNSFWPSQADPCLWIADYCTWAIFRKYESGGRDLRSYEKIAAKIDSEHDLWSHGTTHYY